MSKNPPAFNGRIPSPNASRIEGEFGEPLKVVLRGFAEQAEITRLARRDLAETLEVPYQTLNKWLRRYGIEYPIICSEQKREAIIAGHRNPANKVARYLTAEGRTRTLGDWAADLGCKPSTITNRLSRGWPEAKAVTLPVGSQHKPRAHNLPKRPTSSR